MLSLKQRSAKSTGDNTAIINFYFLHQSNMKSDQFVSLAEIAPYYTSLILHHIRECWYNLSWISPEFSEFKIGQDIKKA